MDDENTIKIVTAILASGAFSSLVVGLLGKRKEKAEIKHLTAETTSEQAEAATTWLELSLRLQEQREKDIERLQSVREELHEVRVLLEAVKLERDLLFQRVKDLENRLRTLENGG